jgi:hypothetical protein
VEHERDEFEPVDYDDNMTGGEATAGYISF